MTRQRHCLEVGRGAFIVQCTIYAWHSNLRLVGDDASMMIEQQIRSDAAPRTELILVGVPENDHHVRKVRTVTVQYQ